MFHISWNIVPYHLEDCSMLAGTAFQLSDNTTFYLKEQPKEQENVKPNPTKRKARGKQS